MAAVAGLENCGDCCKNLKELLTGYQRDLGLTAQTFDGTKFHSYGVCNFYQEESRYKDLIHSIRSKCLQCSQWPDARKAILASKEHCDQLAVLSPIKDVLQECIDKLLRAMKDTSLKGIVQCLESVTREAGLKFDAGHTGNQCFISSDMFYVEVIMDAHGFVSEVKVAHDADPVSSPKLTNILRNGNFTEFAWHLKSLRDLYKLPGDTFQKTKIFMALQAMETDITTIARLSQSSSESSKAIMSGPVGFVSPRQGGSLTRLTYLAPPPQLLDVKQPGEYIKFTDECPPAYDLGFSVTVSVEQGPASQVQTAPIITNGNADPPVEVKMIQYRDLNDNNSEELPVNFVLKMDKPLPVSADILRRIHKEVSTSAEFVHSSTMPLDALIVQECLDERRRESLEKDKVFYANLPDQNHVYNVHVSKTTDQEYRQDSDIGLLVSRIPFKHPSQVNPVIKLLRRQAMHNALLISVLHDDPPEKADPSSKKYFFELSASSHYTLSVTFQHPLCVSMASVDFIVNEENKISAVLNIIPGNIVFCSNEWITGIVQKCISIPLTMRSVIRKAFTYKPDDSKIMMRPSSIFESSKMGAPPSSFPSASATNMFLASVLNSSQEPGFASLLSTSPTFNTLSMASPSPTFSAFSISSISPTFTQFPFTNIETPTGSGPINSYAVTPPVKQYPVPKSESKSEKSNYPPLPKITLKRKMGKDKDEYVILSSEPKTESMLWDTTKTDNFEPPPPPQEPQPANTPQMHPEPEVIEQSTAMDTPFQQATTYTNVTTSDVDLVSNTVISSAAKFGMGMPSTSMTMAATDEMAMGEFTFEELPSTGDVPGMSDLEGILGSLPHSHLPPGIVSTGTDLDFESDLGFDIDATIDARTAADPTIAGTAGSGLAFNVDDVVAGVTGGFDVDSELGLDLMDSITRLSDFSAGDSMDPNLSSLSSALASDPGVPGGSMDGGLFGTGQDMPVFFTGAGRSDPTAP